MTSVVRVPCSASLTCAFTPATTALVRAKLAASSCTNSLAAPRRHSAAASRTWKESANASQYSSENYSTVVRITVRKKGSHPEGAQGLPIAPGTETPMHHSNTAQSAVRRTRRDRLLAQPGEGAALTGECLRSCRQLLMLGARAATAAARVSARACEGEGRRREWQTSVPTTKERKCTPANGASKRTSNIRVKTCTLTLMYTGFRVQGLATLSRSLLSLRFRAQQIKETP